MDSRVVLGSRRFRAAWSAMIALSLSACGVAAGGGIVLTPKMVPSPKLGSSYYFIGSVTVKINCGTSGATIYYTTDGSTPTAASAVYTAPFVLTTTTAVQAMAVKSGQTDSGVGGLTYVQQTVATPVLNPVPPYTFVGSVHVSATCLTGGAAIRYTTDGSEPTSASLLYTGAFTLTTTTNLRVKAFKAGMLDSATVSGVYAQQVVVTPTLTPAGPLTFPDAVQVAMSCPTKGAVIRYTTDATYPTNTSTVYTAPLNLTATTTVAAVAFNAGMVDSDVAVGVYTKGAVAVATPVLTPAGPYTFIGSVTVSITCATSGATIRCTTDGTDPTAASPAYSAPLVLSGTTTLKARAFKNLWDDSAVASGTYTRQAVATPVIAPPPYTFVGSALVSISCATQQAAIHYTTDGTAPTPASPLYKRAFSVVSTTTVKAMAVRTGFTNSAIVSATYTEQPAATPVFNPAAPDTFVGSVQVTVTCATAGASIYYTTDGSTPTASSTAYTAPVNIAATTTLKAIAVKSGIPNSAVAVGVYTQDTVATPTFDPAAPTFVGSVDVAIACATSGAAIYYTTDGSTPTTASAVYGAPIHVTATTPVKALATKTGMLDSAIGVKTYTQQTVARPVFAPAAPQTFAGSVDVTISCATAGASVYYTTDGSDPTAASTLYAAPVHITSTTTLKAIAVNTGMLDSLVETGTYTQQTVATPTFLPAAPQTFAGSVDVTISCTTAGASIYYTTDGSGPTAASTPYTGPVHITSTTTLKAIAVNTGMLDSPVASGTYTQETVAMPTFDPPAPASFTDSVDVTISCATDGATIYYTTDGSDPSVSSAVYGGPVHLTATTTLKAFAVKTGMLDSAIASGDYTAE